MRNALGILVWAATVAAVFIYLHTGARTASTCVPSGAGVPDGMSLWPPGTICSGGEPEIENVYVHPAFPFAAAAAAVLVFVALRLTRRPAA